MTGYIIKLYSFKKYFIFKHKICDMSSVHAPYIIHFKICMVTMMLENIQKLV